ncbi:MAG: secretin N-terminal domain-containing protein [Pseudomonadota bacterium]
MNYKIIVIVTAVAFLVGCMKPSDKNYNDNLTNIHNELTQDARNKQRIEENAKKLVLPASVSTQMMPSSAALPGVKDNSISVRFDVSVNNVAAKEFFSGLSQGSGYSLILAPGVTGNITLKLKQVTLTEALDAVSDLYGYHYEKTSYGYKIYPKELQTRIFMLDKLMLQRTLQTNTQINSSGGDLTQAASSSTSTAGSTITPSTVTIQASQKDTFWSDMTTTINALIGANGNSAKDTNSESPLVQVTADTGMVLVRAYPKDMALVEQYIIKTQNILGREVIIEAEILDVVLASEYSAGIDWAALTAGGSISPSTSMPLTPTTVTSGLLSSVYNLSMSGDRNNFNYALSLISTQGKVSVLSKPRVSAINNQSAIIKVGSDNYYVTNVQSQVTTGGGGESTNTTTSTINLQAFFSGISLYVTPQITEQGEVNLHIHPSVSKVSENILTVNVDGQESQLPVAQSDIRETDTVVHAKDGQVIILGGLMQTLAASSASGLPLNSKYQDTLGAVTTAHQNTGVKSELVILLRPIVVQDNVWKTELDKTAKSAYSEKSAQEFFRNE